jgi:diadenosine tetraphosphate (Ap4A) HIT family hydrolase
MSPQERLQELADGQNVKLIARMPSGFAVMGDYQFLPGYCLLLAYPMVEKLNDLHGADRMQFLVDMGKLGDAVLAATGCARINNSMYGNLDPFLHAHIWPRYEWEEPEFRTAPPFQIPVSLREAKSHRYDPERHREIQLKITEALALAPG